MITKITGKLLDVGNVAATLEIDAFEYEVLIPEFNPTAASVAARAIGQSVYDSLPGRESGPWSADSSLRGVFA